MHALLYLLKLQIEHVNLDDHGNACQGMPKDAFENLYILKTVGVPKLIFGPLPLAEKGSRKITTISSLVYQYVRR